MVLFGHIRVADPERICQLLANARRGGIDIYFEGDSIRGHLGATDFPSSAGSTTICRGSPSTPKAYQLWADSFLGRLVENGSSSSYWDVPLLWITRLRPLVMLLRQSSVMQLAQGSTKLVIVCGLPGSGKTTHAKQLEPKLQAVRFCPDEWFEALSLNLYDEERRAKVETLQWQLARKLLSRGVSVIIEWGTWGRSERDMLRLGARDIGVAVELHYLSEPVDILFNRLQCRGMESPPIEREQVVQWAKMFQEPTPEEMALFDDHLLLGSLINPASGTDLWRSILRKQQR